tara:strand:+ start:734 stop:994 length:261 start_codon:yes stop_codon:yes gene_type:complete
MVGKDFLSSHKDGIYCVYASQHFILEQKGNIKVTINDVHFASIKLKGPCKRISRPRMKKLTAKYGWYPPKSKISKNWCLYFEYDTL